ncbi:DUF1579 family protein [Echinicola salinicaeni]|uniref:DUF1579 family protein n=1 Tax=Echinicola salinicaeni TaxID=2762757 RepID=UPI00164850CB|nr:DUF1579 family protein [Echinicola salinicaeni]
MRKIFAFALFWIMSGFAMGQNKADQAMEKLAFLEGDWSGIAKSRQGAGQLIELRQYEDVSFRLDGNMLLIEGKGYVEGSLKFNAVAVITYNQWQEKYEMMAWRGNGQRVDAYFKELGKDNFEWGFDIPQGGKMKYVLSINDSGQWHEVGEYSPNGEKWYPSFEMTLDKK